MQIITDYLNFFKPVFGNPSLRHFKRLVLGFASKPGCTAVTEVNDSHNSSKHFSTVYDFLKLSKWSHLNLARFLLIWFLHHLNQDKRLVLCIDDTKAFKPHAKAIPKLCWHADHHHLVKTRVQTDSGEELTATGVVGHRGHCWVVLAALHKIKPGKWCCFPILGDIFLRQKHAGVGFRTKLQIGQALLAQFKYPERPLLVGDNYYGAKDFVNGLEADVLSLLKSNAVAYEPAPEALHSQRGRPRKYGRKVKLAEELDSAERLEKCRVDVYGDSVEVEVSRFQGLLKGHKRRVQIVLVKGLRKDKFLLFTNDLSLSAAQMIEYYAARFQIEIAFRELKQEIGTFNYRLRTLTGVMRYVHLSFVAYALVKYLALTEEVKTQKTAWYTPRSMASPRRVQQAVSQKIQAFRIFKGLQESGYLRKNISSEEFIAFQTA